MSWPPLPTLPDQGALPVLQVHLGSTGLLGWKLPTKGARWRGRCNSMQEVCAEADAAGAPAHCVVDFVEVCA